MKGLPACGKTTKAEEIHRDSGNAIRLNKDLMRTMLHFDKWSGRNENITRNAMRVLAREYLLEGKSVIIDDTNLNGKTMQSWKDLAAQTLGTKIEIVDMTNVPVEECVMRDTQREKSVGGTVIKNMALRYGLKTFSQGSVVLCDIDGTIADTTHRLHYVNPPEGEKKDWKGFFSEMASDPVRDDVRKILIQHYNEMKTIIFLSARPETYKDVTLKWLDDKGLGFAYTLIMRQSNDKRADIETKKDMLDKHFPDRGVIHTIIDDRPSVIRMWKEEGLNVVDVGKGIEF
jgi:predicted kinase